MPAVPPHFDAAGLCEQALQQDFGLWVVTNDPSNFRRAMYTHMRKTPSHKLHIFADPTSATRFALLKSPPEAALEEPDAEES
jgi:hypothetical protein